MRLIAAVTLLALATFKAHGDDALDFACEGAFAPDSSHERLIEAFGADNVTFTEIRGDEGTIPWATVVFPTLPSKRLSILWHGDERNAPNVAYIGTDSLWTVAGLRVGMTVDEVEGLNGGPFVLGGFNDMDRGMVDNWGKGALPSSLGACDIRVTFGYPYLGVPLSLDDPLSSEGQYSSQDPAYRALGAKISGITIVYPATE